MPGLDPQAHRISGISHCQLQFVLGFHAGAHMVMESQRDTLAGTVLRQPRESLPVGHKFRFKQYWFVVQWLILTVLHGLPGFTVNQYRCIQGRKQLELGLDPLELLFQVIFQ